MSTVNTWQSMDQTSRWTSCMQMTWASSPTLTQKAKHHSVLLKPQAFSLQAAIKATSSTGASSLNSNSGIKSMSAIKSLNSSAGMLRFHLARRSTNSCLQLKTLASSTCSKSDRSPNLSQMPFSITWAWSTKWRYFQMSLTTLTGNLCLERTMELPSWKSTRRIWEWLSLEKDTLVIRLSTTYLSEAIVS